MFEQNKSVADKYCDQFVTSSLANRPGLVIELVKEYYQRYAYAVRRHFDGCQSIRIGEGNLRGRERKRILMPVNCLAGRCKLLIGWLDGGTFDNAIGFAGAKACRQLAARQGPVGSSAADRVPGG
jgi:hypothetical protein